MADVPGLISLSIEAIRKFKKEYRKIKNADKDVRIVRHACSEMETSLLSLEIIFSQGGIPSGHEDL